MIIEGGTFFLVIDRDGATCQNNNHFKRPTILNAPWDEHSMMFFKSVADLYLTGPFAVLGKAKYQYRPLRASKKRFRCESIDRQKTKHGYVMESCGQTDGRYETYYLPCFAVDNEVNK